MFDELTLSSIQSSVADSPTSSSPLSSSTIRSRTSTITSNSCVKPGVIPNRQMKIGNYYLERTIGKGNFAVVKLATHCDTHQKVAIKIIDKSRLDPNDHQKLEREIAVMKSLIHPHIIRLYEVMESKNLIYLVTEYAANGELLDSLLHEKRFSEAKAKEKFRQLVLAVEYIHSKNIVHRDLKAENLLLDEHGNIKVADFGFANIFKANTKLQTFCGSPPYAAPELFQCLPYAPEKVDVWSLGVLLYAFVCGHLPFDSNNLPELRKRVLSGQFRLPFYISSDCSSLISHMLNVDPEQRYSIKDIKNHPWLMLIDSNITSETQSVPNCQLTNAILDHAESLGYNRTQILKSVNGNSYDSDAAIWHLLLEKFQKTCQIDSSSIVNKEQHTDRIDSTNSTEPEIHIDFLENYSDSDDDDDEDDDDEASEQLREQYARIHGLRRHTVGRPDLLLPNQILPTLTSKIRYTPQLTTIESSFLPTRLNNHPHQQQQQQHEQTSQYNLGIPQDDTEYYSQPQLINYHQRNPHATSSNGLFVHTNITAVSDVYNQQQRNNHWLYPPIPSHCLALNRRASDSGANLFLFHHQNDVTHSNTNSPVQPLPPPLISSPISNQSSRGSITRGAPIALPTFSIVPHETTEKDDVDEDAQNLARYLTLGKRHTVCEQGVVLGGKARRGTRETPKDRGPLSRRSSDTSSNLINSTTKAHLERLYNNAVTSKLSDEDDVTTSSLQELHKLQKQVQKYPINNNTDSPILRRGSAVPSPTNSVGGLHIIREEHQQKSVVTSNSQNRCSSSSSSEEALYNNNNDDDNEMDCDVNNQYVKQPQRQFIRPPYPLYRPPYHPRAGAPYYCNLNPLLAQRLAIPTTSSSYTQ